MVQQIKEDKKSFSQGKRRTVGSKSMNDLAANAAMGGALGTVGVVEVEVLVVLESHSAPAIMGVVHHKPFDISLLPEEESPDYSKYIQCPHCGRRYAYLFIKMSLWIISIIFAGSFYYRFDPMVSQRHIEQCKDYDFNKDEKEAFRKSRSKSVSKPK